MCYRPVIPQDMVCVSLARAGCSGLSEESNSAHTLSVQDFVGSSNAPGNPWVDPVLGHGSACTENSVCSAPLWKLKFREVRLAGILTSWAGRGAAGRVEPAFALRS